MTDHQILAGSWGGAGGRLRPATELHNLGLIELPAAIVAAAGIAADLKAAVAAATADVSAAEKRLREVARDISERLVANGPTASPGAPILKARRELEALVLDRDLLLAASTTADRTTRFAFDRAAPSIGDALAIALTEVLEAAAPDAPLMVGVTAWSDPDLVHEMTADQQAAFHRLEPLAAHHDLIRTAALGLHDELLASRGNRAAANVEDFHVERFIGAGIVGPLPALRGVSPDYSQLGWAWRPTGHPVARLAAAALAAERVSLDPPADETDTAIAVTTS